MAQRQVERTRFTRAAVSHSEARKALTTYLLSSDELVASLSRAEGYDVLAARIGRRVVPHRFRFGLRLAATRLLARRHRRRAQAYADPSLRVHLGSQKVRKEGWINVDLAGFPVELAWDLTRPLPFESGAVDAIFHEHLLEHFTLEQGLELGREAHRLLKTDGILRIGVPDAQSYLEAYSDDPNGFLASMRPSAPTPLLAVQELFYWPNHRTMYDFETLELLLKAAGFENVRRSRYGESRIEPCPDSPHRRAETLYVEALKT